MANPETIKESQSVKKKKLTPKQYRFCLLFAAKEDFFGNGTRAYQEAFGTKKKPVPYISARAHASRLLKDPRVCERINKLLEEMVLNNQFVDKQLGFLISQHSDFSSKLGAIREYNKLKKRISEVPQGTPEMPFHIVIEKADDNKNIKKDGAGSEKGEDVPEAV